MTPTAQAAHNCGPTLSMCLYFNSNQQGSYRIFEGNTTDFTGYTFSSSGAGQGQAVKNNAASASNGQSSASVSTARIYFNSNYGGVYDDVAPATSRNLVNTYNDNASFRWINNW
ncbi:peptidase inhibitor family I36 protein [Streptomyces sp. NPDC127033]|uniref:peptidase inhibitor family I36 protein n=1 Tax=Streptomyces sp. NPDC127033 TaxID=3347110 RepID=UPI0036581C1B